MSSCKDCKYWQGNQFVEWADCYRVLAALQPEILQVENQETGEKFRIPFDPHYVKDWSMVSEDFCELYANALAELPNLGIRTDRENGITYIQTHKNYCCGGNTYGRN